MSGNKMRLNEKNVINFATCNSPVDKEGWLLKKAPDASSGHGRGFQKRYFTLKGNLLFYFDKKGDKEPLGVIIMEGCTVELVEVPDQAYTFGIHFQVGHDLTNFMKGGMVSLAIYMHVHTTEGTIIRGVEGPKL